MKNNKNRKNCLCLFSLFYNVRYRRHLLSRCKFSFLFQKQKKKNPAHQEKKKKNFIKTKSPNINLCIFKIFYHKTYDIFYA